ncbi:tetratricopeptide repeat protein [bacterium]|nr:tetratricopeptide repeat protein [bacterium]
MRDSRSVGPQSDVYSLGAVLYECASGRAPVTGETMIELIDRVRGGEITPLESVEPSVPAWLARIVMSALSRNPWERYADAAALARALETRDPRVPSRAGEAEGGRVSADMLRGAARSGKTNLLPHSTAFVGRRADLDAVHALFARGDRLVTLTGPGGTGKTRLASRYGAEQAASLSSEGGVWFCDLCEAQRLDGILASVGDALGVALTAGASSAEVAARLGDAIRGRGRVLVILDNFEQVVAHAAATVARWLEAAPEARFLVTSRELLRLRGEVAYELEPLSLPEPGDDTTPSEAVQLFLERARAARHDYAPSPEERSVIAEIVRRLDGMPLAIELAAARTNVLGPRKLLERLPRRFDLLASGRADANARHATLRATIDWSWNLLETWEKTALAQCAVFRGGFSLDSAEAVLDLAALPDAPWIVDVLQALCEKSLVRSYEPPGLPGERRFGLYESIREYAREKLAESPLARGALDRHAEHFLRVGREWARSSDAHGGAERLRRLSLEQDNLVAVHEDALARAPASGEAATRALGAVVALVPVLLETRGPVGALLDLANAALSHACAKDAPDALRAAVHSARGDALCRRGEAVLGRRDLEEALALALGSGDRKTEVEARCRLSALDLGEGRESRSPELERELARAREQGDRAAEALLLNALANAGVRRGLIAEPVACLEQELAIRLELGDRQNQGIALSNLGSCLAQRGLLERARSCYEEALAIARELADLATECQVLSNLGGVDLDEGRHREARASFEAAQAIARRIGNVERERRLLYDQGQLLLDEGRLEDARACFERALAQATSPHLKKALEANVAHILALTGRLEEARSLYSGVVAWTREIADRSSEAFFLGCLGATEAALRRTREATGALDAADTILASSTGLHGFAAEIAALQRATLEVGRSREAAGAGRPEEARALLQAARALAAAARGPEPAPAGRSRRVRQALRFLEGLLALP